MLVLTRKLGERISIGHDVEVVVLKVSGNRVRLGLTAPAEVSIRRDDIAKPAKQLSVEAATFAMGTNATASTTLCNHVAFGVNPLGESSELAQGSDAARR